MRDYFIRRFLLIPPTLLGVTLLVFVITRFAPGGPVERALHEAQKATEEGGSGSGQAGRGPPGQVEGPRGWLGWAR